MSLQMKSIKIRSQNPNQGIVYLHENQKLEYNIPSKDKNNYVYFTGFLKEVSRKPNSILFEPNIGSNTQIEQYGLSNAQIYGNLFFLGEIRTTTSDGKSVTNAVVYLRTKKCKNQNRITIIPPDNEYAYSNICIKPYSVIDIVVPKLYKLECVDSRWQKFWTSGDVRVELKEMADILCPTSKVQTFRYGLVAGLMDAMVSKPDKRVWIGQLQFAKIPTYGKNEYIGSIHINCDFSPKHKSKTFLHLTSLTGNTVVNRGKSSKYQYKPTKFIPKESKVNFKLLDQQTMYQGCNKLELETYNEKVKLENECNMVHC